MSYFTVYGTCESFEDTSYTREIDDPINDGQTIIEIVKQMSISLAVPGNRDLVRVSFGIDAMPDMKQAQQWEDNGTVLLKVSADICTLKTGVKNKRHYALVSYHGVGVQEASSSDVKALSEERKTLKARSKERRDAERKRIAQQKAAIKAQQAAAQAQQAS